MSPNSQLKNSQFLDQQTKNRNKVIFIEGCNIQIEIRSQPSVGDQTCSKLIYITLLLLSKVSIVTRPQDLTKGLIWRQLAEQVFCIMETSCN